MNKNVSFHYSEGTASCFINYNGITFCGEAHCHMDDKDFESERTGLQIAEIRANIKVLQFRRDTEIKPQIKILTHLLKNIQSSNEHNPKAYESIMIKRQLKALNSDLEEINNIIKDEKDYLKNYINQKDHLYNKLRAKQINN